MNGPDFFCDKVNDKITSVSIGSMWCFYYSEALVAVHHKDEFLVLKLPADLEAIKNKLLTPGILEIAPKDITEIIDDLNTEAKPQHVDAEELQRAAVRLAARELTSIIDKELMPS